MIFNMIQNKNNYHLIFNMIHDILAFTEDGSIFYSWQSSVSSIRPTNKNLLSGFFNSMNSVLSEVFKGKLQRVILEDRVLCMTGGEVKFSERNNNSHWILTTITVDKNDDINLVKNITNNVQKNILQTFEIVDNDKSRKNQLDEIFDSILNKKVYRRTKNKLIISSILVFCSMVISEFISTSNIKSLFEIRIQSEFMFLFGIIIGFLLVIPSAAIAGNRMNSTIIALCSSALSSIFSFILLEFVIQNSLFGGVGTPIVFIGFSIFVGISCGIIGGTVIDRYYLYG